MPGLPAIADKTAHKMADLVVRNLASVDEIIFGVPAELNRELFQLGIVKLYVRVGEEIREYLPVPTGIVYRMISRITEDLTSDERTPAGGARPVNEEMDSAMIKAIEGFDTRKFAKERPLMAEGTYRFADGIGLRLCATWWSDNTVRLRAAP